MKLGIIGGSGLYNIENLVIKKRTKIKTPFGHPSDSYITGYIQNNEIIFLPRHGEGHIISPSEINHRANIYGFKKLGVTHILSFSAVGSLQEELSPKDIVLVDQYFDRTKQSVNHTFFCNGIAAHVPFGDPTCTEFRNFIFKFAKAAIKTSYSNIKDKNKPKTVNGGTYVNMEGPAFSTRAESNFYKSCGFDLIGMTSLGEAKLSREAEICYCPVAMVTDYDCWHSKHEDVSVDMVIKTMQSNIKVAKNIILLVSKEFKNIKRNCSCGSALKNAIITPHDKISSETKTKIELIAGKYLKK